MKEFLRSFVYAVQGIWSGIRDQRNLKFQLAVAVVVVIAGFYLSITAIEWCIILICIALVIGLELVNTALENLVDLVTLERNPLAGKIKDIAAAAVLITSVISLIIGLIVFRKYLV
jgi:diacylglycerol kinase (ATP)